MENKQIIVDGINISECEFCDWKGSNIPQCRIRLTSFEATCKGYNCYYKQLKRKEQEGEGLKKELEAVYDDCKGCPTCNEALYNADLYAKECRELKKTLTEIKEICNNNDELQGDFNVVDCDKYKLGKHNLANKILQKISECEVEE